MDSLIRPAQRRPKRDQNHFVQTVSLSPIVNPIVNRIAAAVLKNDFFVAARQKSWEGNLLQGIGSDDILMKM